MNAAARAQFRSICAIVPRDCLHERFDGAFVLVAAAMSDMYGTSPAARFAAQPVAAIGAAALIAADVAVTAAHIPEDVDMDAYRLLFGYAMTGGKPKTLFPAEDVFEATLLFNGRKTVSDIATLKLDRPAPGTRPPLAMRRKGVRAGEPLYMIGFPIGLPAKLTDRATVLANDHPRFFETDLDAMDANSGSPVFSAATREIVGVLSSSPSGFTTRSGEITVAFAHTPGHVPVRVSRITNLPRTATTRRR